MNDNNQLSQSTNRIKLDHHLNDAELVSCIQELTQESIPIPAHKSALYAEEMSDAL